MIQEPIYHELLKYKYKRGYSPPKEQILLTIQGQNILSMQNYLIISGLPKSGKSTFTTSIVASGLNSYDIFGMKLDTLPNRNKICYIDTESSEYDFYKHMDRIKKVASHNELPLNFDSFCLRKESPESIKLMVDCYIANNPECSVLIIDGLLDICLNYNDEVECRKVVTWIKTICTINNIVLIGILHTGKNEGKTLGHLGSNTDRWAQSTLSVKKDEEGIFILEPKFLRSSGGFTPIHIQYCTETNNFIQVNSFTPINDQPKEFKDFTETEINNFLNEIFKENKKLSYDQLIKKMTLISKFGINKVKNYIKFLRENEKIKRDTQNNYTDGRTVF